MKIYTQTKDLFLKNITGRIVWYTVILKAIITGLIILNLSYSSKILTIDREIKLSIQDNDRFTEIKLKRLILDLNMKYPDVVLAQAKIESGNFKSKIFLENNNLFGMRQATNRPTTSSQVESGYAYYMNWKESVIDYALYQSKYLSDLTREQYLSYLGKNYAEDPQYKDGIIKVIEKVSPKVTLTNK